MALPTSDSYKDLHSGMKEGFPKMNISRVEEFLEQQDKKLDDKGQNLYEDRFLRNLRLAEEDSVFYLTSSVWAEMKKNSDI